MNATTTIYNAAASTSSPFVTPTKNVQTAAMSMSFPLKYNQVEIIVGLSTYADGENAASVNNKST